MFIREKHLFHNDISSHFKFWPRLYIMQTKTFILDAINNLTAL